MNVSKQRDAWLLLACLGICAEQPRPAPRYACGDLGRWKASKVRLGDHIHELAMDAYEVSASAFGRALFLTRCQSPASHAAFAPAWAGEGKDGHHSVTHDRPNTLANGERAWGKLLHLRTVTGRSAGAALGAGGALTYAESADGLVRLARTV